MSDADTERKSYDMKKYMKNYYPKKLLNDLINHVEKLENVSLSKQIFIIRDFLNSKIQKKKIKNQEELWGYENCDKLASYLEKLEKHKK